MSQFYIGEIRIFPYNFAPRFWATCSGQLLSIAQNTALFSLLGTTYGGNGQTTFALPDLRGRVPVSWGQGPGLNNVELGEVGGSQTHTLISNEMPQHTHSVNASTAANSKSPSGKVPAVTAAGSSYGDPGAIAMAGQMIGIAGGSQPFSLLQPYLGLNVCIALQGIFPSRN